MHRPQTPDAWTAVFAGVVVVVAAVVLVVGVFSNSPWWPIACGVFAAGCLVSAMAQLRMQTRKTSRRE